MKLGELRKLTQTASRLEQQQMQQWLQEQFQKMGMDPKSIYQELEMTSRYVDTHRDISYTNSHVQLHSHTFYELLYCCGNCDVEYLIGSNRYRLQQGDIIFVPPGISHRPLLPEQMKAPYERYVLWLSQEFMELYAHLLPPNLAISTHRASMLRFNSRTCSHLAALFLAGVQEAEQQNAGWEAAVMGNTLQLLTQIWRATAVPSMPSMHVEAPELLDRITAYIESHYAGSITIGDLSRVFYVSSSTISHLFRQKLGVSFYRYVTQRRLIAAKTLIEQGHLLESVANQTGFADYSGFYRAFKQEFGISPRQYRVMQESRR